MPRRISIEILSFTLIVLFLYASISKAFEYERFSVQVDQSPLLTGMGNFIPALVILLETTTALLLMSEKTRRFGFTASFSLMTMFTAYIIAILKFSPFIPCSCGGILDTLGWQEHLLFNGVFIIIALLGIILHVSTDERTAQSTNL